MTCLASLLPNPFEHLPARLNDARHDLIVARLQLNHRGRRTPAAIKRYYAALDAVWAAQGGRNPEPARVA